MPSRAFADFSQAVRGCEGSFGLRTSLFRKVRNTCEKGRAMESSRKRADRKEEVVNFHFSSSCLSHFARSLSLWRFWGKGCPRVRGAANLRIPGQGHGSSLRHLKVRAREGVEEYARLSFWCRKTKDADLAQYLRAFPESGRCSESQEWR